MLAWHEKLFQGYAFFFFLAWWKSLSVSLSAQMIVYQLPEEINDEGLGCSQMRFVLCTRRGHVPKRLGVVSEEVGSCDTSPRTLWRKQRSPGINDSYDSGIPPEPCRAGPK